MLSRTRKHSWHIFRRYFLYIPSVYQNCKWEHTTSQSWNALALPIWQCSWSGKGWKCLNGFGTWTCYHKTVKHIHSLQQFTVYVCLCHHFCLYLLAINCGSIPYRQNSGCRFSTEGAPENCVSFFEDGYPSVDQRPSDPCPSKRGCTSDPEKPEKWHGVAWNATVFFVCIEQGLLNVHYRPYT